MNIQARELSITQSDADAVILYYFLEDNKLDSIMSDVNSALDGLVQELVDSGDVTGKVNQTTVLYSHTAMKARRVILVGLGSRAEFDADVLRRVAATGARKVRDLKVKAVASSPGGTEQGGLSIKESAQAIAEGSILGLYSYHGQKSSEAPADLPESLDILVSDNSVLAETNTGIAIGKAFANGACLARDLVNLPPNFCTPTFMADQAQSVAENVGLDFEALEEQQMRALKMGALLGVAQGSDAAPRFIILQHNADRANELDTVVLIGKGVTFDTGGYSLKSSEGMVGMKADMGGGAAVIGAMQTVGELDLPLHVVGLIPASDNMISGHAYRPQEVVTASNGTTIEVISTDAEGRMLLADALVYANRYDPKAVVDIATLTGACVIALGGAAAGLFSTDDSLRDFISAASSSTGEKTWPMPLFPEYEKAIESETADIKNTGGRRGGVGTSAVFLKHFVDFPAWAHIDMAGMAGIAGMTPGTQDNPCLPAKGATGFGARLLAEFVRQWAEK